MEECVVVVEDVGRNVVDVPRLTNASPDKYWVGITSQLSKKKRCTSKHETNMGC